MNKKLSQKSLGNDVFQGNGGNDIIDGGADYDIATYSGEILLTIHSE